MSIQFKIILGFIAGSLMLLMGYCIYQQHSTIKTLQTITESQQNQQKYLEDNIVRIQSTLVSKDEFSNKLKELDMNLSAINKDMKSIGAKATSIITLQNETNGTIEKALKSSGKTPNPPGQVEELSCKESGCYQDKYGYFKFQQQLDLKDSGIPLGSVTFNATSPTPWNYNIFPRTYSTSIVLALDKSGNKSAYAKVSIKPKNGSDESYDLPQTQVSYTEELPSSNFSWWNPRVMAGLVGGISSGGSGINFAMIPSLQLFTSSYGQVDYNSKFSILGLGFGYDITNRTIPIVITPFTYRIFDGILFQNINIGPSFGADFFGRTFVGLQLNLGL